MEAIGPRTFLVAVILHALIQTVDAANDNLLVDKAIDIADKTLDAMGKDRK